MKAAAELGPPVHRDRCLDVGDCSTGVEAVQARSFVTLELEELEVLGTVAGRGDDLEMSVLVAEDHACRVRGEELDAAVGQSVQKVQGIELVHEGVGQLHEDLRSRCSVFTGVSCLTDRLVDRRVRVYS